MTRLFVNADDFGLTPGVNRSILELHRAGALTSATLMASAAQTPAAVESAAELPDLGIGCHVVLVDGRPVLPGGQISALAPSGEFRPTLGGFVRDLIVGKIPEAEIEMEAVAQIRRLQEMGARITHVDTHKHAHMFPQVLRPLLRAAVVCGIGVIRNPFEPDWALEVTRGAPAIRRLQVRLLRTQRPEFLKLVEQAGLTTTDGAIGVLATGTLNATVIETLLNAMHTGTWELVCHPGHLDDDLKAVRTRLRESREIEHTALLNTVPAFLIRHPEIAVLNFGQL
jgi:chitin disaccharide deacetylase